MKTRTKIFTSIVAVILGCVLLFGTFAVTSNNGTATETLMASERTVELNYDFLDDQSIVAEFDEFDYQTDEKGFDLVAKKTFNLSVLSEIDLVGFDETEEQFTIRYDVQYIENDDTVFLTVTIEDEDDIPVVETIPGLVTYNSIGEPDIMFVVDGEYLWLSDLSNLGQLDEVGWFSNLLKSVQKAINKIVETVVQAVATILAPAIKIVSKVAVALLGANVAAGIGAFFLNMSKDEQNIYHADFDCWQQYFGYMDLYDVVFDAATSMRSAKYAFDIDNDKVDDYILWAWKGDYLNLGAGAELGIYKRWRYWEDVWQVDKSLAMKMTLQLDYKSKNIINWQPTNKQWWITGFNYNYQNVKRDDLLATYSVIFNSSTMYNAFWNKWSGNKNINFNASNIQITFTL